MPTVAPAAGTVKSTRCDLQGTPAEILRRLGQMIAQDKQARSQTTRFACSGCLLAVIGVVGLFLRFGGEIKWPAVVMMAVGLVGTVASVNLYKRYSPLELDPGKLETARRLLEVLSRDLHPGKQIKLRLDFRESHAAVFVSRKEGDKSSFAQTWLDLEAAVLDGTRLGLEVTRRGRRRVRKKRRGESVKGQMVDLVKLSLRVNPKRYPDLTPLPELLADPPLGLKRKSLQAGPDWVKLVASTAPAQYGGSMEGLANGARLLGCLAWGFHALKSVKVLRMK